MAPITADGRPKRIGGHAESCPWGRALERYHVSGGALPGEGEQTCTCKSAADRRGMADGITRRLALVRRMR